MPVPAGTALLRMSPPDEPNSPWCWNSFQTLTGSKLAPWQPGDAAVPGTYLIEEWNEDAVRKVAAFRERFWQLVGEKQVQLARMFVTKPIRGDQDVHTRGRVLWAKWVKQTMKQVKFVDQYNKILKEAGVDLGVPLRERGVKAVSFSMLCAQVF